MRERSECHPTRFAFRNGVCQRCWKLGLNVPRERAPKALDPELARLQKNWVSTVPDECPKCRKGNTLQVDGAVIQCMGKMAGCGWTGYVVREGKFAGTVRPTVPVVGEGFLANYHGGGRRVWRTAVTVTG